ncbi:MAG: hypothetical protein JXR03_05565 [Cyclobacteriaceae bacterium]
MLKYSFLFIFSIAMVISTSAQTEWQWPSTPELKTEALEKQAYYKVLMNSSEPEKALSTLHWLYNYNPQLHPSIYKDGAKNIENILKKELSKKRREELEDSLIWMYDQRIDYFGDKSAVDRRAYTAFKLHYKNAKKYPLLSQLYDTLFTLPSSSISDFNLTPYMTLGVYYFKAKPKEFTAEMLIDVYDRITEVIEAKKAHGGNTSKMQKEQDKVDALFGTSDPLDCEFIEIKMLPRLKENPENIKLIKKTFAYLLKAKCTDKAYFLDVAESLYEKEPSAKLAKIIADRYSFAEEYVKAIEYYKYAESLTTEGADKYELLFKEAQVYSRMENKVGARKKAIEALSVKPEDKKSLNLIGNLYFKSYDECKEGESRVIDRSVFLAAYEMYRRAGNEDMMKQAKEQFPSIEDIFNEGFHEGDNVIAPCWIQMSIVLQRR